MIERFEALAQQVWPPAQTQPLRGWQLGFSDGCTKRANSVQTLAGEPGDAADLKARIERCEALYRERSLPVIFKLTPVSQPEGLDAALDARGYRVVDPTSVRVCDALPTRKGGVRAAVPVSVESRCSERFRRACMRLNAVPEGLQPALAGILDRIEATCRGVAFASVEQDAEIVAQGIGVLQGDALCLCEIATHPQQRRRGLASQVVLALADWAHARAAQPWLQVVASNAAAVSVYDSLGFREVYRYWYRVSD